MGRAGILAGMNKSQRPGPEQWRQIIDGQRGSGLTVAAYCRDRGITDSAFYAWKRRLRSATPLAKSNRSPTPAFVEVKPANASAAGAIEICLPGDRRLLVRRGFDRELLIELVRALEGVA
jgi:transposase-like protein